jgi:hypothetical protein
LFSLKKKRLESGVRGLLNQGDDALMDSASGQFRKLLLGGKAYRNLPLGGQIDEGLKGRMRRRGPHQDLLKLNVG